MPRRKPRDLESYSPAEEVARSLEDLASKVRRGGGLVKFSIQLWFWEAPPIASLEEKSSKPVIDLMEALKASLAVSAREGESIADRSERRAARYTREDGSGR